MNSTMRYKTVRWRGRQRERRDQRNARHNPIDQEAYPDHRDDHQGQREAKYLSPVLKELARGRFPAVGKQQRRDEQHEEQFGIELHMQAKRRPCQ